MMWTVNTLEPVAYWGGEISTHWPSLLPNPPAFPQFLSPGSNHHQLQTRTRASLTLQRRQAKRSPRSGATTISVPEILVPILNKRCRSVWAAWIPFAPSPLRPASHTFHSQLTDPPSMEPEVVDFSYSILFYSLSSFYSIHHFYKSIHLKFMTGQLCTLWMAILSTEGLTWNLRNFEKNVYFKSTLEGSIEDTLSLN